MQFDIIFDVAVSPNLAAANRGVTCGFPLSARLGVSSVISSYRQGATKNSHDGVLLMQRSTDGGRNWFSPQMVANGLLASATQTVVTGGLCQTPFGALLASFDLSGGAPKVYPHGADRDRLSEPIFLARSDDCGVSWSAPKQPDPQPLGRRQCDGQETRRSWDTRCPGWVGD